MAIKGILSKFVNDNKMGGALDSLQGQGTAERPGQIRGLGNHQLYQVQQGQVHSAPGIVHPQFCVWTRE